MGFIPDDKIIAIHQPNYLPWLGYFYKIYKSDLFVFLDDGQFIDKGMHNYTYIKTHMGSFRLKIPVQSHFGDSINMVRPRDELGWKEQHLKTLECNYKRAKYFEEVYKDYRDLILREYNDLATLDIELIKFFAGRLGIKARCVNSSVLNIKEKKTPKIIEICKVLGGTIYFSGKGAYDYQDNESYRSSGLELIYSDYEPIEYPQLWDGVQTNVSALDFFMNCGYDWGRVLKNLNKDEYGNR